MSIQQYEYINWRKAYKWLDKKQEELLRAYETGDEEATRRTQVEILKDFRTTAIAVRRVTHNKGAKTPGVDGKIARTSTELNKLLKDVWSIARSPNTYNPQPVRRVCIPKSNGKKCPLGIPTILDRAVQALYLEVMDPLVEVESCANSYGFRKYRGAGDAVLALKTKLCHPKAAEWVLNADIEKCFEKINHDFLIKYAPLFRKCDKLVLKKMLKAGMIDRKVFHDSTEGTPQGGILSPTLANVALNGLEKNVLEHGKIVVNKHLGYQRNPKVHVVRYADDFIIIAPSKKILKDMMPHINEFLEVRGLRISQQKTSMANLWTTPLDFLGFTFMKRKYNHKKSATTRWTKPDGSKPKRDKPTSIIDIQPTKANIKEFRIKTKSIVSKCNNLHNLVRNLNPYIRGWANYFKATNTSAEAVRNEHRPLLLLCRNKVKKLYVKRGEKYRKDNFFPKQTMYQGGRSVTREWVLTAPNKLDRPSSERATIKLFQLDAVVAPGRPKLKLGLNAYRKADIALMIHRTSKSTSTNSELERAVQRQKHLCAFCKKTLHNGEMLDLHHIPAFKELTEEYSALSKNVKLVALHRICHQTLERTKKK